MGLVAYLRYRQAVQENCTLLRFVLCALFVDGGGGCGGLMPLSAMSLSHHVVKVGLCVVAGLFELFEYH